jgi:hypothetical protein
MSSGWPGEAAASAWIIRGSDHASPVSEPIGTTMSPALGSGIGEHWRFHRVGGRTVTNRRLIAVMAAVAGASPADHVRRTDMIPR